MISIQNPTSTIDGVLLSWGRSMHLTVGGSDTRPPYRRSGPRRPTWGLNKSVLPSLSGYHGSPCSKDLRTRPPPSCKPPGCWKLLLAWCVGRCALLFRFSARVGYGTQTTSLRDRTHGNLKQLLIMRSPRQLAKPFPRPVYASK